MVYFVNTNSLPGFVFRFRSNNFNLRQKTLFCLLAYVKDTDEARLPLGEEFQKHVKVFLKVKTAPGGTSNNKGSGFNKAYKRALKLIDQLE